MSLLLSHLKTYDNTTSSENSRRVQTTKGTEQTSNESTELNGREWIKGEILKGQIVDLRSNQATIQLTDGTVMQGKVDQDVELYIGQTASFEVSKQGESEIHLKLLPEQQSNPKDSLIGKALIQAGLPLTDKNQGVVNALLDANLSVDKQSILKFLKLLHQFPKANPKDLVFLQKHNLPINETNLGMVKEYQNSEHRIISQVETLANGISEAFSGEMEKETVLKLFQLVLDAPEYVEHEETSNFSTQTQSSTQIQTSADTTQTMKKETLPFKANPSETTTSESLPKLVGQEEKVDLPSGLAEGKTELVKETLVQEQHIESTREEGKTLREQFTPKQLEKLTVELEKAQVPKEIIEQVKEGKITAKDFLKFVSESVKDESNSNFNPGKLQELMRGDVIQKVVQEALIENHTLSPKQLVSKENVKKFYEKLEQNLEKLSELVKRDFSGESATKLTTQTEHLKQNLDFMKTLNQIYPYIQLPVRLKNQNLHSELYVFTKRKGARLEGDSVSLLLNLDMEQLGGLDIHLNMNKTNLKAKFFVETKEIQTLFETTIHELEAALEEKGYHLQAEFSQQEKSSNAFDEMLIQEQASEGITMKRYTFDVRA